MVRVDKLNDYDQKALITVPHYYSKGIRCRVVCVSKDHPYYRTSNKGNVSEARLIMAEHLGRNLTKDDIVYFKDEDVTNISIDNLINLTKREYFNVQTYARLKKSRDRIISKMSVHRQRIIDSGIDPDTLIKDDPEGRWREVDRDREARERGRRHSRGEDAEYL